jgi:methylated-DNA-[protein]-cysteine S-methyltransferase
MLSVATMPSPVGDLTLAASDAGLRYLLWPDEARVLVDDPGQGADTRRATVQRAIDQLLEYFDGERTDFDLPLDPQGTPFQLSAWMMLRTIPYGQTVSYAFQARSLGDVNKSRAVGAANGRNPISIIVPCHRVVGSNGSLTGFGGGMAAKAWLLDHEKRVIAGPSTLF